MRKLIVVLALSTLLSGCAFSRWMTESATPEDLSNAERALAAAERGLVVVQALAGKIEKEEYERALNNAMLMVEASQATVTEIKNSPSKPRWSSLVDLGLGIAAAFGVGWAGVAQRGKRVLDTVLSEQVRATNAIRVAAKAEPVGIDYIDTALINMTSEQTKEIITAKRARLGLANVNP